MSVAALAGRRVDPRDASATRFPAANVALVRNRIQRELEANDVRALVCSAACGADLLALAAAADLGIRYRIVLPGEAAQFRRTSVVDRPGDWGPLFDRIVDRAARGDLVLLATGNDEADRYLRANVRILDDAQAIAADVGTDAIALIVWEGTSRGEGDATGAFAAEARRRGIRLVEISTMDGAPERNTGHHKR